MNDFKIFIKNKKKGETGEYIGRPSPLGNPFHMEKESDRDYVINKYKEWFLNKIEKNDKKILNELKRLKNIGETTGVLNLLCWCSPKECHGDIIKEFLETEEKQMEQKFKFRGNFRGDKFFLSNFYPSPIIVNNKLYLTSEHYFQACKAINEEDHEKIRLCETPGESKKMAYKIEVRQNWDDIKLDIMYKALCWKFFQNIEIARKLYNTGDEELIEYNNWNDTFWGKDIDTKEGKNNLGKLLMEVRDNIKKYFKEINND